MIITLTRSEKCKCEKCETVAVVDTMYSNSQWNYIVAVTIATPWIQFLDVEGVAVVSVLSSAKALKRNKWMKMKWKRFQFVGTRHDGGLWRCGWNWNNGKMHRTKWEMEVEKANGTEKIGMEKKCMLHSASADSHLASQIAAERNAIVASVRRARGIFEIRRFRRNH